ncbi:MAG: transcription antitermination factor NusB [Gemmatimonadota bacterium]
MSGVERTIHLERSRARAWAVQVLYQWEMSGEGSPETMLRQTLGKRLVGVTRIPYLRRLIETYGAHRAEVDAAITGALKNWRLERLAALDRSILRVAATEVLLIEEVPRTVAIHEAVLLAERYGGADSPPFVNGVLEALERVPPRGSARVP